MDQFGWSNCWCFYKSFGAWKIWTLEKLDTKINILHVTLGCGSEVAKEIN